MTEPADVVATGTGAADGDISGSGNVSSTIMFNIATESLPSLRKDFDKSPEGLSLIQFLNVMVKTMQLSTEKQLMSIIPDLVDFFKSVGVYEYVPRADQKHTGGKIIGTKWQNLINWSI